MSMRTRNGNQQDPDIERELAAVDAALAGQPVDADLTELAGLVLAVHAERPRPRAQFAEKLDARVAAGFPRMESGQSEEDGVEVGSGGGQPPRKPTERKSRLLPAIRRRRLPLAFGTAASLLIVVTAIVSSGVLSEDRSSRSVATDGPPSTDALGTQSSPATGAAEAQRPRRSSDQAPERTRAVPAEKLSTPGSSAGVPRRGGGVLPQVRNRLQDRDAAIVLAAPRADIEDTADGVIQVTGRYEGFVLRSNVSGGDEGRAGATLELRIPSDKLQPALRDLSELAHVRSRTQTTQDITARFVSARSRLNEAVAERRALLRQLARAATPNEAGSIRVRLRLANRRIAAARSNLRSLRNRVDFSSVSVAIEADESAKATDSGWSPGDALHDALGILETTVGILLVSLAVLVPLSALGLLVWLATSSVRRGRRERALDQQPQN
jgi:uncharacterized protein DUF4349